jgi:hypothetical protein
MAIEYYKTHADSPQYVRQVGDYNFIAYRLDGDNIALVAVPNSNYPSRAFICSTKYPSPYYKIIIWTDEESKSASQHIIKIPPQGWVSN